MRKLTSKNAEERKQAWHAWGRLMLAVLPLTVLLFSLNHDKDWYKEDVQDYEKQNYWLLGENLRIPKGFDFGLRFFSNLLEEILNYSYNNDPKAFEYWWAPIYDELPDLIPSAAQPLLECWMNYDLFRKRNIVPQHELQDKRSAYLQYDQKTSELAKFLGEETNLSPRKIDHFIFGFTGNLGREAMRILDSATGAKEYNAKLPNDIPLFGGLFRMPYRNPKILADYYKVANEQNGFHTDIGLTGQTPEGYNPQLYQKIKASEKTMSKLARLERAVIADPKLSSEERDAKQLEIQKRRIEIAKKVLETQ